jgi:hypothetical protein
LKKKFLYVIKYILIKEGTMKVRQVIVSAALIAAIYGNADCMDQDPNPERPGTPPRSQVQRPVPGGAPFIQQDRNGTYIVIPVLLGRDPTLDQFAEAYALQVGEYHYTPIRILTFLPVREGERRCPLGPNDHRFGDTGY